MERAEALSAAVVCVPKLLLPAKPPNVTAALPCSTAFHVPALRHPFIPLNPFPSSLSTPLVAPEQRQQQLGLLPRAFAAAQRVGTGVLDSIGIMMGMINPTHQQRLR